MKTEKVELSVAEVRTYALSLTGRTQSEIGNLEGISDRQVRYRLSRARKAFDGTEAWSEAIIRIYRLIPKALDVLEKYLDGQGKHPRGDLSAALRLLDSVGVLRPTVQPELKISQSTSIKQTFETENYSGMTGEEIYSQMKESAERILGYLKERERGDEALIGDPVRVEDNDSSTYLPQCQDGENCL